jgi:ABC-type lipoprotein export system ATPase subunit
MNDLVLKIENLTRIYRLGAKEVKPLVDLNLEVKRCDFASIMGPSVAVKLPC